MVIRTLFHWPGCFVMVIRLPIPSATSNPSFPRVRFRYSLLGLLRAEGGGFVDIINRWWWLTLADSKISTKTDSWTMMLTRFPWFGTPNFLYSSFVVFPPRVYTRPIPIQLNVTYVSKCNIVEIFFWCQTFVCEIQCLLSIRFKYLIQILAETREPVSSLSRSISLSV